MELTLQDKRIRSKPNGASPNQTKGNSVICLKYNSSRLLRLFRMVSISLFIVTLCIIILN